MNCGARAAHERKRATATRLEGQDPFEVHGHHSGGGLICCECTNHGAERRPVIVQRANKHGVDNLRRVVDRRSVEVEVRRSPGEAKWVAERSEHIAATLDDEGPVGQGAQTRWHLHVADKTRHAEATVQLCQVEAALKRTAAKLLDPAPSLHRVSLQLHTLTLYRVELQLNLTHADAATEKLFDVAPQCHRGSNCWQRCSSGPEDLGSRSRGRGKGCDRLPYGLRVRESAQRRSDRPFDLAHDPARVGKGHGRAADGHTAARIDPYVDRRGTDGCICAGALCPPLEDRLPRERCEHRAGEDRGATGGRSRHGDILWEAGKVQLRHGPHRLALLLGAVGKRVRREPGRRRRAVACMGDAARRCRPTALAARLALPAGGRGHRGGHRRGRAKGR
mmetsp:Transcript_73836/g.210619  ORF Transcript_73836/g.210619 Transcript_73836/m.210619 type:complete len:392 (+) Transcript_73836:3882-5057(+)